MISREKLVEAFSAKDDEPIDLWPVNECRCCGLTENQFPGRRIEGAWYCGICVGRGHHIEEKVHG